MNPTLTSLIQRGPAAVCFGLAKAGFQDTCASDVALACPPPAPEPLMRPGPLHRFFDAVDGWFHRQTMKERDAYLGQARDIYDLEDRIRRLERQPYY